MYNHPPNLTGWHGRSLKPPLERELGLPVHVGHDATLAALAEARFGAHRGARDLLYVTISTGVGGGIIANGDMVTGATGGAGEVGHITIRPGGLRCRVNCDGCFEGNASGTAIAQMAADRIRQGEKSMVLELADGDPDKISGRLVFEAAQQGDMVAASIIEFVIDNIGIGLGGLLNVFDPEVLVAGGGVVEGMRPRWQEIREATRRHSLPRYSGGVQLEITTLGDDVSLLGAAELAFRRARGL
jgi:glucokinase